METKLNDRTDFKYNLAQNLVSNKLMPPFDDPYYSLVKKIEESFKKKKIIDEILKLREENAYFEKWDSLECKIRMYFNELERDEFFQSMINMVINIVGREIYSLSSKVSVEYEFELLIKYLVLNNQNASINLYKTVIKVLDESNLSNDLKFRFACKYFIGKEIIKFYGKSLPEAIRNSSMCCKDQCCATCLPFSFWQVYLREDNETSRTATSNDDKKLDIKLRNQQLSFPFIFKWALDSKNDIALQYLWENISHTREDLDRCSEFINAALLEPGMENITAFLISETQGNRSYLWKVQNLEQGDLILEKFFRNRRWLNYIINIINASNGNIPISYVAQCTDLVFGLKEAVKKNLDIYVHRSLLEQFLQIIPTDDVTVMERFQLDKDCILYPILKIMDSETMELLLKIYRETDVLRTFDIDATLALFEKNMTAGNFLNIEKFLKKIFKSKEEMLEVLCRTINVNFSNVCENLILSKKMNELNRFLEWCENFIFKDLSKKKVLIPFKSNGEIIRLILFIKDKKFGDPFEYSEQVLLWSFGDKSAVDKFKKHIVLCTYNLREKGNANYELFLYDDLKRCVEREEFGFLDRLFQWSGCCDDDISALKSQMANDLQISRTFCSRNNHAGFWKFSRWCVNAME